MVISPDLFQSRRANEQTVVPVPRLNEKMATCVNRNARLVVGGARITNEAAGSTGDDPSVAISSAIKPAPRLEQIGDEHSVRVHVANIDPNDAILPHDANSGGIKFSERTPQNRPAKNKPGPSLFLL
jgi:hypothetical protein